MFAVACVASIVRLVLVSRHVNLAESTAHWNNNAFERQDFGIVSADYNEYSKRRAPYPYNPTTNPNPPYFSANKRSDKLLVYGGSVAENILNIRLLEQALSVLNADEVPDRVILRLHRYIRDRRYFPNNTVIPEKTQGGELLVPRRRSIPDQGEFLRRMTWLYPDDGCYYRADMASNWAHDVLPIGPKTIHKIFLFGNPLVIKTNFTLSGQHAWVYHVAPLLLSQEQRGYVVIDPALNFDGPLPVKQWILKQTNGKQRIEDAPNLKGFAITNRFVFTPSSVLTCDMTRSIFDPQNAFLDPYRYLNSKATVDNFIRSEWNRVEQLGLRPLDVLGDYPPWTQPPKHY